MPFRKALAFAGVVLVSCTKPLPPKVESGFDMSKNSMSFANFATGYEDAQMTPESMQRMFGTAACRNQSSPCELTLGATAFMNKANKAMLGGRCEGFAVLSTLMFSGKVDPTEFGGEAARDLVLADNVKLQNELAYWFTTQLHPSVVEKTKGYMAKDVMAILAEGLSSDAKERYRIGIVKKNGDRVSGGHALTPIGYYPGEAEGIYKVRVYDNNLPDTVREIRIDTKMNRWEYEASENPSKKPSLYFGDATNKNPLYLAPILVREGELACHFCGGSKTQVTTSGGIQALVNGIGVKAGEAVTGDKGTVSPTFTATNDEDGASYNIIVNGLEAVAITLVPGGEGNDTTNAGVQVSGEGFSAALSSLNVSEGDGFDVGADGRSQSFTNASRNPMTLTSQVENGGRVISIMANIGGSSDGVTTNIQADGQVEVGTTGSAGTQVTVQLTVTESNGTSQSGTVTYMSNGDSTLSADSTELAMTGTLTGTLDNNGMMQTVGNACADGLKSGMESDVDCGGTCTLKCNEGATCNTGIDCLTAACSEIGKKCVATTCEDEGKTGDETDVDCGGSCATRCAVNKACTTSVDCAPGLTCDSLVCKASYVLRVAVAGLRIGDRVDFANATNSDTLTVTSDGAVAFPSRIVSAYAVSISAQPSTGTCTLTNGVGTAAADVTLNVNCVPTHAIGGVVSGLNLGNTLVVRNNAGDDLTIADNGAYFFAGRVPGAYAVTVFTQPMSQVCTVSNATGTATADVSNVDISCGVAGFQIGGSVSGLGASSSFVLQNNGGDNLTVSANGSFAFATPATAYNVTILTPPTNGSCTVSNGTGTATAAVTTVQVTCVSSGTLDLTFNGTGSFYEAVSGRQEWFRGVVNPDNSTTWVGRESSGAVSNSDIAISRLTASGQLDLAFGASGHLILFRGVEFEQARAVHRLASGSYLVAAEAQGSASKDFTVLRVTAAGAVDTTFGTSGFVQLDSSGNANDILTDMVVRSDGSIILVGNTGTGLATDITLMALTPAGALDVTFGTGGKVTFGSAGVADVANAVAINASGDIIVVGARDNDSLILRYNSFGVADPLFGTAGALTSDLSGSSNPDALNAVYMNGNEPVVAGFASNGVDNDMLIAHFTFAGMPNSSFGTNGVVRLNRGGDDRVRRIIPAAMGGFYFAGSSNTRMSVGRLQSNGTVLGTFGVMGFFEAQFALTAASASDILVDGMGRLVVGGGISDAVNPDFGAARLTP